MSTRRAKIEAAIAALKAQRQTLGDEIAELALAPLREQLTALDASDMGAVGGPRLKQVSILFVDVVGSTSIGSRLDPEDVHELMDRVLRRFTSIVEAGAGRVLQYTGDGLLAAFGADDAHEHDAENAVRAGLAILDETRRFSIEATSAHRLAAFDVRVGVDTGPVLVGGGIEREKNIRGHAVNFAARMEQSAPAGGLRISQSTYRHVRGVFEIVEEPPIRVKGITDPVRSYLVHRAVPRAFRVATRGIEGVETRMVARDVELSRLQRAFAALHDGSSYGSVTIIADPGVGKSRLLYEFDNWAEMQPQPCSFFKSRAQSHTRQQPYGLLRDLLARRLEGDEDVHPSTVPDRHGLLATQQRLRPQFESTETAAAASGRTPAELARPGATSTPPSNNDYEASPVRGAGGCAPASERREAE